MSSVPLSGQTIGAYLVRERLGAGGMGEVYRARDSRLGRDVAIKVLPQAFTADRERLARFEREARVMASLNHPHIAQIYGLEEAGGTRALVLELVEGRTLAELVATRGPKGLGLNEALTIARQVADALDAAHEKGVVHRDLKPANVIITPAGVAKVLDFGLATTHAGDALAGAADEETVSALTEVGTLMGTAPYMSPEQARGQVVDKRTDIWALGCTLFEMLTGRRTFDGASMVDTLVAITERDPEWALLPESTPPGVRRLLRHCLEKDPRKRLRDAGDARLALDDVLTGQAEGSTQEVQGKARSRSSAIRWASAGLAVGLIAGVAGWFLTRAAAPGAPVGVVRLSIAFLERPVSMPIGSRHLAISSDGTRIVYASSNRLWLRRIDQDEPVALPVLGSNPFFSKDGAWVGAFAATRLLKVPVDGGPAVEIVATSDRPAGASWSPSGSIVFATTEGLFQVPDAGGTPRLLAKPDRQSGELLYAWPQFLPDERFLLFTVRSEGGSARVAVLDLETLEQTPLLEAASSARYVPSGHLLFFSGRTLRAVAFDAGTRQVQGERVTVPMAEIGTSDDNGAASFEVSDTGTLVFTPAREADASTGEPQTNRQALVWVDRQDRREPLAIAPGSFGYPRVSPDGTRVALDVNASGQRDIWILNLQRLTLTQLTHGPTEDALPEWGPDGRIYFGSDRAGNFDVYSQAADGASGERLEYAAPDFQAPSGVTPDGRLLLIYERFNDLSLLRFGERKPEPLLHSSADEAVPDLSPDGRWMAYESDESGGQFEVFLRPFPDVNSGREKISVNGGRFPRWSPKGNEIHYLTPDGEMMAASITFSPNPTVGSITKLFDWIKPTPRRAGTPYDVSPLDGRFLMAQPVTRIAGGPTHVSVVLNWTDELKRLIPR
jgi:serine/threonine protein kinase